MTDSVFPDSSRFVISANSGGAFVEPMMTTLADGRIVVTWHDGGTGSGNILHRIYDVDGTALTGEIISTTSTANDQRKPAIAALKDGGFVIVWEDNATDLSAMDVRYRVFDANGVGGTVLSATAGESSTNWQTKPAVIGTADGGFVIAWTDENGTNSGLINGDDALVARSFAADGTAAGGIVRVSGPAATGKEVALDSSDEGVVFVWDDDLKGGIYSLTIEGGEVPDSDRAADGTEVVGGSEFHKEPDVAITSAGTVVVWADGTSNTVFYRIGTGEVRDVHVSDKSQTNVRVDALPFGGFVVTWQEDNNGSPYTSYDVMVRVFDSTGAPIGAAQNLTSSSGSERETEPEVTALIDGRFMLSWVSDGTNDIYGQIFDSRIAAVTWTGGTLGERFVGTDITGSGDVLDGADGNDRIFGQKGNDTISGGEGNDLIDGGAGTDRLIGGLGNDTYVTDGSDVIIEQADEGIDTIRTTANLTLGNNIENLQIISATGRTVSGNSGDNTLTGGNGDDRIDGGGGTDRLVGGAGNDTYVTSGDDTIVEAANKGTDTVRSSGNHILATHVENLVLTGTAALNGTGNGSNNRITGNSGNNRLDGGAGADDLFGGSGNDSLIGGTGQDDLTGGAGSDHFVFTTAPGSSNVDTITDYNVAADTIRIDNAVFTGLAGGGLSAGAFARNATGQATDRSDRIIYETDTGKLYFDRDGTGSAARVHFATLDKNLGLTHADFFVF